MLPLSVLHVAFPAVPVTKQSYGSFCWIVNVCTGQKTVTDEPEADPVKLIAAHSKAPKERFNVDAFHQQGATHPDNLAADGAHFLEQDVSSFDAPFFGITAEEAKAMDPQARMLLETSYEALENAGLSVESVVSSFTQPEIRPANTDIET